MNLFCSVLQDMKRKINNLKDYHSSLMEMLSDMLAEHFPLPDPQGNGTKKKRVGATVTSQLDQRILDFDLFRLLLMNIGFRFFRLLHMMQRLTWFHSVRLSRYVQISIIRINNSFLYCYLMLLIILRGRTCEIIVENKFPDKILFYQPYLLTH